MKRTLLITSCLLLILGSCCKVAEPLISVMIVDSDGNNLLDSAESTDSTWCLLDSPTDPYGSQLTISQTSEEPRLHFGTHTIESEVDYYLRVDSTDVDTFNVDYKRTGRCNAKIKIFEMNYNGEVIDGHKSASVTVVKY